MRSWVWIALAAAAAGPWLHDAVAQTGPAAQPPSGTSEPVFTPLTTRWTFPNPDAVNAGTVTIITAPAGGAKSVFAADMARVLDEKDKLRILPILGKGPVQNVIDIFYLKSVDMGLVATDVPEFYKIQYGSEITDRLRYIMKLYNDEIHIIAPTEIKTVFDLEGKRIEAPKDVGLYSAKAIFSRLNINVTYDSSHLNDDTGALQEVIDGRADAWIVGTAKVMPIARNLKNENRRLHLVSIPYDQRLQDLYLPSEFTSDEYPNLIPPGEKVDTVAAGILLVVFNWPEKNERYQKVARFVDALFSKSMNSPNRRATRNGRRRVFPRSYPGGNGSSPRRTGSIVGVRNTSTWLTRLRSPASRTLWRIRERLTCPRKNSKSCTHSSWNGIVRAKN